MKIILFFTYGISLLDWKNTGLLDRELKFYEMLNHKYEISTTLITYGNSKDLNIIKDKEYIKVIPIYSIIKYDRNKYLRFIRTFILPIKLRKTIRSAKILKTNQLLGSWVAILSKLIYKKPLIVRTGYDLLTFSIKNNKSSFKVTFYKYLTKNALKYSDIYLVTSKADKKNLNKLFTKYRMKIKVRPNWVEINEIKEFNERFNNKIISVGRLEEQKNYSFLINKLKKSKFILDIYGDGSQKKNLILLSKKLELKLNIFERIDNNHLIKNLIDYKIFISSSNFEGNPKAILEAMAAGCVVLAKENDNILEIIENNRNGIIYNEDTSLVSLINKLFHDPSEWERISGNAVNSVKENNSLFKVLDEEYSDYRLLDRP